MALNADEQKVIDEAPKQLLIGGEWRDAIGRRQACDRGPLDRARPFARSPTERPTTRRPRWTRRATAQADWAATPPNERSEILHDAFKAIGEQADDLALLMTLEMGKSVAESKAELTYAAEFFRWFAGEALRIDGYYKNAGNGASRVLVMRQPVGPLLLHHPLELPERDGHAQDRPGARRRLHDGREAGAADAALDARAGEAPRGVRPARRRPQRDHLEEVRRRLRADHRRPAPSQALLHRLDRGRAKADRPGRRQRPEGLDGARRQRAVPGLRGRRRRRRDRGRDDRQDAKRRRGLHLGQPLPRPRVARRRVRREARRRRWAR